MKLNKGEMSLIHLIMSMELVRGYKEMPDKMRRSIESIVDRLLVEMKK